MASKTQQEIDDEFNKRQDIFVKHDTDIDTVIKTYDEYDTKYEQDMVNMAQHKKHAAVDELVAVVKNKEALILDLGAGTGIIGQYLYDRGYKNLVALEPSQGMVDEAKRKNIYKEFVMEILAKDPLPIAEGTYDAIICVGALVKNHITDEAFPEIIRLTKKGGYIVFLSGSKRMEKELQQYEESMQRLVDAGRWRWVSRKVVPEYYQGQEGICFVLQKPI